jgi:hypothetical protein
MSSQHDLQPTLSDLFTAPSEAPDDTYVRVTARELRRLRATAAREARLRVQQHAAHALGVLSEPNTAPPLNPASPSPASGTSLSGMSTLTIPARISYQPIWEAALQALHNEPSHGDDATAPMFAIARVPQTLTGEAVELICQTIEAGATRTSALALAGVTNKTALQWIAHARAGVEPHHTLLSLLELAESRLEAKLVHRWAQHTADSWQAAQALLSRRFPAQWSERKVIEFSLNDLSTMSIDELAAVIGPDAQDWLRARNATTDPDIIDIPTLREEDFADQLTLPEPPQQEAPDGSSPRPEGY